MKATFLTHKEALAICNDGNMLSEKHWEFWQGEWEVLSMSEGRAVITRDGGLHIADIDASFIKVHA